MSLDAGRGKLRSAMKELRRNWEDAKGQWNDPVSRHFEETYWQPLEAHLPAALRAIDQLEQALARLRHDCS